MPTRPLNTITNLPMAHTLYDTHYQFPGQQSVYKGKVREVYALEKDLLVMIATDRLSAFDVVMPKGIPYKGQILNQIATKMMADTADIVPNWLLATPDPNVAIGHACEPFKVEMVIRGYMSGHAAREYRAGKRLLCGVPMPEGMRENDPFPSPIITPATKAEMGDHDEDISKEAILKRGIVSEADYAVLEKYTHALFQRGTEIAAARGLILVDTKYEFGKTASGEIVLIDEIHTPDSSRYFYAEGYAERQEKGESQRQLSKEFVRQWLIQNGFQGLEGQQVPEMSDAYIQTVSERYIELYEKITGESFQKAQTNTIHERIEANVLAYLQQN
jgi:phosphoribosylaminoimidazole-succinocarboxamide synthase